MGLICLTQYQIHGKCSINVCTYISYNIHMSYISTYTHTYISTCMYICVCMYTCIYVCILCSNEFFLSNFKNKIKSSYISLFCYYLCDIWKSVAPFSFLVGSPSACSGTRQGKLVLSYSSVDVGFVALKTSLQQSWQDHINRYRFRAHSAVSPS